MKNDITDLSITDFMNTHYAQFAKYVAMQRALPEMDGLKQPQRIAVETLMKRASNTLKNVSALGGATKEFGNLHGDASANNTIINLVQDYKNTLPLFKGKGQFGNLRSQGAGAPRYIEAGLSENFHKLYKDMDLVEYHLEKGKPLYPKQLYPILPVMLLNGSTGIAVGFSCKILNRSLKDVIKGVQYTLNGKEPKLMRPYYKNLKSQWFLEDAGLYKWLSVGDYEYVDEADIKINSLPWGVGIEAYKEILYQLTKKDIVSSYYDLTVGDDINILVNFNRDYDYSSDNEDKVLKDLKLIKSYTENFTYIHEGQVQNVDSPNEIIKEFVEWRLGIYQRRKDKFLNDTKDKINFISKKAAFVKAVIDGELEIRNVPLKKVYTYMDKHDMPRELLSISVKNFTLEAYKELINDLKNLENQIIKMGKKTPKDLYLEDLKELKKAYDIT